MTNHIPKRRISRNQTKDQKLKGFYTATGESKLQLGSYEKIAKSCNVGAAYVRHILNPKRREWNAKVYSVALTLLKKQSSDELKLAQQAAEAIKQWSADFEVAAQIMEEVNNG